jgi:hypothetical protein
VGEEDSGSSEAVHGVPVTGDGRGRSKDGAAREGQENSERQLGSTRAWGGGGGGEMRQRPSGKFAKRGGRAAATGDAAAAGGLFWAKNAAFNRLFEWCCKM